MADLFFALVLVGGIGPAYRLLRVLGWTRWEAACGALTWPGLAAWGALTLAREPWVWMALAAREPVREEPPC